MIAKGLHLLKGGLYEAFPTVIQEQNSPEWESFARIIQDLRDELVSIGNTENGSLSIEDLDKVFRPEVIPAKLLLDVANMLNARLRLVDDPEIIRRKIGSATQVNRRHATTKQIKELIEEITGVAPVVKVRTDVTTGWDDNNTITPPGVLTDFRDGIVWDETEVLNDSFPKFLWQVMPAGLLIDIGNNGNYTDLQLNEIYSIVAELKNADLAADIGYTSTKGSDVVIKVIFSSGIASPPFVAGGLDSWPSKKDSGL